MKSNFSISIKFKTSWGDRDPITTHPKGDNYYYRLSDTKQSPVWKTVDLQGMLLGFSTVNNSISFLRKTQQTTQNFQQAIAYNVGGLAKLKDFTFTMLSTSVEVVQLLGCEVTVTEYNGESDKAVFKGKVHSIKEKTHNTVTYSCEGVLANSEYRIEDTTLGAFTASDFELDEKVDDVIDGVGSVYVDPLKEGQIYELIKVKTKEDTKVLVTSAVKRENGYLLFPYQDTCNLVIKSTLSTASRVTVESFAYITVGFDHQSLPQGEDWMFASDTVWGGLYKKVAQQNVTQFTESSITFKCPIWGAHPDVIADILNRGSLWNVANGSYETGVNSAVIVSGGAIANAINYSFEVKYSDMFKSTPILKRWRPTPLVGKSTFVIIDEEEFPIISVAPTLQIGWTEEWLEVLLTIDVNNVLSDHPLVVGDFLTLKDQHFADYSYASAYYTLNKFHSFSGPVTYKYYYTTRQTADDGENQWITREFFPEFLSSGRDVNSIHYKMSVQFSGKPSPSNVWIKAIYEPPNAAEGFTETIYSANGVTLDHDADIDWISEAKNWGVTPTEDELRQYFHLEFSVTSYEAGRTLPEGVSFDIQNTDIKVSVSFDPMQETLVIESSPETDISDATLLYETYFRSKGFPIKFLAWDEDPAQAAFMLVATEGTTNTPQVYGYTRDEPLTQDIEPIPYSYGNFLQIKPHQQYGYPVLQFVVEKDDDTQEMAYRHDVTNAFTFPGNAPLPEDLVEHGVLLPEQDTIALNLNSPEYFAILYKNRDRVCVYRRNGSGSKSNPIQVIKDALIDYAGLTTGDLHEDAFDLLMPVYDGYNCSYPIEESRLVNKVLDDIARDFGLVIFEREDGLVSIITLDPSLLGEPQKTLTSNEALFTDDDYEIKEEYTSLNYLISEMDVEYSKQKDVYVDKIESADLDQTLLVKASTFLGANNALSLRLVSVFEEATAHFCARVKMYYHSSPTRLVTIPIRHNVDISLGDWIFVDSRVIANSLGRKYLVMSTQSGINTKTILLYEFTTTTECGTIIEASGNTDVIVEGQGNTDIIVEGECKWQ